jgi:hypothetical protein
VAARDGTFGFGLAGERLDDMDCFSRALSSFEIPSSASSSVFIDETSESESEPAVPGDRVWVAGGTLLTACGRAAAGAGEAGFAGGADIAGGAGLTGDAVPPPPSSSSSSVPATTAASTRAGAVWVRSRPLLLPPPGGAGARRARLFPTAESLAPDMGRGRTTRGRTTRLRHSRNQANGLGPLPWF